MPLYVVLCICTHDLELARHKDFNYPACNFELPAYNEIELFLRVSDSEGLGRPI